jgi:hypothetical protein
MPRATLSFGENSVEKKVLDKSGGGIYFEHGRW